ncbi:hypothetical protein ACIOYT_00785 [Streptomyces halstedii]|uniref:hypothetical protein n=1 Tax=Streptomyces halstedii TaxID=1944 RepID=UPI0038018530
MTHTPMTPDRDPSRRKELLFMLLHGGARDESIAQRVVDLALAEAHDQVDFLERNTLPDLHRQIEYHKGGKARWRKRAETAEARVAELEANPALEYVLELVKTSLGDDAAEQLLDYNPDLANALAAAEEARDKCNHSVDTDALGMES